MGERCQPLGGLGRCHGGTERASPTAQRVLEPFGVSGGVRVGHDQARLLAFQIDRTSELNDRGESSSSLCSS